VGVAAPVSVALGGDQHVLAERREVPAAERAAVGRRLAILGPASRPPPGRREPFAGHDDKHGTAASPKLPLSSPGVEQRPTRIMAETERYRITGVIRLPPDGYRSRLSDYLNTPDHAFVALTEVEITPLSGNEPAQTHPFLALSLRHIVFAVPLDER
jgi:hypothetical protein